MAAANPLEEILNSEVDESAISALVGSLESQLASPTPKAATQQHLTTSLHSNHNCGEQAGAPLSNAQENRISTVVVGPNTTTLDHKTVLSTTSNASMPPQSTNGSDELVGHPAQLIGINSIVTPGSAAALSRLANVNTRGITPGTLSQAASAAPHSNVHRSVVCDTGPISVSGGIPKHAVVTIGSTNTGTVTFHPPNSSHVTHHINAASPGGHSIDIVSHTNMTSTPNHSSGVMNSIPGNAMFNLANVAAEQKPLMLPESAANDGKQQAAAASRMTVREQIEKQQRDTNKRQHVVVNILNANNAQKIPQTTQNPVPVTPAQPRFVTQTMSAVPQMHVATSLPNATTVSTSVITITRPVSTPQTVTIVRHPSSSPSAPHQQNIQIVNMNNTNAPRMAVSSQKTLAPRLVPTTSIRIATPTPPVQPAPVPIRAPGTPGTVLVRGAQHNTITLPPGFQLPPGAVIVKNEAGQYMVVSGPQPQVQQQQIPHMQQQTSTSAILPQQYKFNTVRPVTSVTQPVSGGAMHQVLTMSQPMPSTLQPLCVRPGTTSTGARAPVAIATNPVNVPLVRPNVAASPQTITSLPAASGAAQPQLENVRKCKNFLTTLIKLAASQPFDTVKNVKNLVQALIDGTVEPDQFTAKLQVELKSSPQPYLIPFLKKSLPLLRQSMCLQKIHIEGVRPPPPGSVMPPMASTLAGGIVAQTGIQQQFTLAMTQPHSKVGTSKQLTPQAIQAIMQQQRQQLPAGKQGINKALLSQSIRQPITSQARTGFAASSAAGSSTYREKRKFESLKEDDDINDVATMGGVNLSEESQNILATNSELMTGQLRSCHDENFLHSVPLRSKINAIAKKHGLDDVPSQVVSLISHATQERLRNIVEKLANIAEHRLEIYKANSRYEVMGEVRPQLKFLEELDRLEKKRHEEAEREVLLRAARSRAKHEDPEQAKLKEKAKALQAAEMEEVRQREANMTALAAIGPRKKRKLEAPDTPGSSASGSTGTSGELGGTARSVLHRPRIKRVNLRDLLFVLEQEREMNKSSFLYKSFLK